LLLAQKQELLGLAGGGAGLQQMLTLSFGRPPAAGLRQRAWKQQHPTLRGLSHSMVRELLM
jgi:hypothetical protein